jgi:RES domain-containing protein
MNLSHCGSLPTQPETGTWYRAIQSHFLPTAHSTAHTKNFPSRFNEGAGANPRYRILYLAENHQVALFEVQALLGSPATAGGVVPHPRSAWTILNVQVNLHQVADLTDDTQHGKRRLATSAQELTGDWRGYRLRSLSTSVKGPTGVAPTQELGAALFAVPDPEGFRAVSAKLPDQMILVIFPDKLHANSSVKFFDPLKRKIVPIR